MNPAPVSAIVTAFQRADQTVRTLKTITSCVPPPAEVLVHVDGGAREVAAAIQRACPGVRLFVTGTNVGPGGGRNTLVSHARQPLIASFDDDSFPMDEDFFARMTELFASVPDAWVIGGRVFHVRQPIEPARPDAEWSADFSGGACGYRRERYLEVGGYVPLADAYNMEEVDFALRLHAKGGKILGTRWLRVFHDTDLARHADPAVTSASVANLALLAFLRYPIHLWSIGIGQCLNRIQWLMRHGRRRGILRGLFSIPSRVWRHRHERQPLPSASVRSYLALRRRPVPAPIDPAIARAH